MTRASARSRPPIMPAGAAAERVRHRVILRFVSRTTRRRSPAVRGDGGHQAQRPLSTGVQNVPYMPSLGTRASVLEASRTAGPRAGCPRQADCALLSESVPTGSRGDMVRTLQAVPDPARGVFARARVARQR